MINQYKYKFYINANHAIFINNKLGEVHPHTWEIIIDVLNTNENFIQFDKIESVLNSIFDKYQDKFINKIEPFDRVNPTLENIVFYFKNLIQSTLNNYKLILLSIEISETPSRSYIINLYDEVDINILNLNKMQNDEDSFIEQIILANKTPIVKKPIIKEIPSPIKEKQPIKLNVSRPKKNSIIEKLKSSLNLKR